MTWLQPGWRDFVERAMGDIRRRFAMPQAPCRAREPASGPPDVSQTVSFEPCGRAAMHRIPRKIVSR